MLDKSNIVQRVQRAHEPRLHVHLPLLLLVHVTVALALAPISRSQVTSLALNDLRKRLVPVVHVYHAPRLEIPPEQDTLVWEFPYGQALSRRVIVR